MRHYNVEITKEVLHSVFYVIRGQKVIITNVLYSASNIENRLKGD